MKLREMRTVTPLEGPYVEYGGRKLLDFSSCDYLGLAQHPDVRKNAIRYVLKYGVGSSTDQWLPQQQLEQKLAHFLGCETALLFSSLHEARAALTTFLGEKKKNGAPPFMDDTETFGIQGVKGFGLAAQQKGVDFILGSCVKGGGCNLAYIGCSENSRSHFSQSWTIPAALLGALDAILNFLPDMEGERETVAKHTAWLANELGVATPALPILSLRFATEAEAQKVVEELLASEIFAGRPEILEISFAMTALHTPDDLDQLGIALKKVSTTTLALATQSPTPTPPR